jgi:hypothetical protein
MNIQIINIKTQASKTALMRNMTATTSIDSTFSVGAYSRKTLSAQRILSHVLFDGTLPYNGNGKKR